MRISRLFCLFGRHRRSRGRARRTEGGFRSCCRRCGVAMRKVEDGGWEVDPAGSPEATRTAAAAPRKRRLPFRRGATPTG